MKIYAAIAMTPSFLKTADARTPRQISLCPPPDDAGKLKPNLTADDTNLANFKINFEN